MHFAWPCLSPAVRRFARMCFGLSLLMFAVPPSARAQLNWEGETGAVITPFAYTSASPTRGFGHPELAFHYLNGGPVLGSDLRTSITVGFLKIGEIGYTRVFNAEGNTPPSALFANGFNTFNIKFRLVPENAHKLSFIPAIAAGSVVRTQVRRVTEVTERENTTCPDFFLVATKSISQLPVPIVLNLGGRLTNSSMMGIAANSPGWNLKAFGAAAFMVNAPGRAKLLLGAEFAQQPHQLKEVPGVTVPTTLSYFLRWQTGSDHPLNLDLALLQLAGKIGPGFDLQARHQFTIGVSYRF